MRPPAQNHHLEQAIHAILSARSDVRLAILFGSLATGAGRPDSDLDLAVDIGRRLTADEKMALISDLAISTGRSVDLVDITAVGEPLLGQILRHGKRNRQRRAVCRTNPPAPLRPSGFSALPQQNFGRKEMGVDREVIESSPRHLPGYVMAVVLLTRQSLFRMHTQRASLLPPGEGQDEGIKKQALRSLLNPHPRYPDERQAPKCT